MPFWESLSPLTGSSVSLPDGDWPIDSPESQGVSSAILDTVRGIQHGVVIRHGVNIREYGDAGRTLDWASCNRTWVDKLWGRWITSHGFDWLDRTCSDLPCSVPVPNAAPIKTMLSYTSLPPVGQVWRYSSGDWWPWQARALSELYGTWDVEQAWALQLEPWLGGSTFQPGVAADGTLRVKASCRDNARLGALILNGGVGIHETRLISAEYVSQSIAGGPNGDGQPFLWELYQTHGIRQGRANAGSSQNSPQWIDLPGVPDGCMALDGGADQDHGWGAIVALPSLDLIVAARGSTPAWWLPTISSACS